MGKTIRFETINGAGEATKLGAVQFETGEKQFWCPYCKLWITDAVHRQHHHNDPDEPDEKRDWRVKINGVIHEM